MRFVSSVYICLIVFASSALAQTPVVSYTLDADVSSVEGSGYDGSTFGGVTFGPDADRQVAILPAGDDITPYLLPAVFVPESLTGMKLLEQFRESGMQMVFVVDEYGDVVGLITLQDFLQALAGEFKPSDPADVWAVQREDGSWLLDGLMPVLELQDTLNLTSIPDEDRAQYHTLSGMIMWMFGRVPNTGDLTEWQGWILEVVDLDGNRIDKVMAYRDKTSGTSNED